MRTPARPVNRWSCVVLALILAFSVASGPGSSPVFAQNEESGTPEVVVEPTDETIPEETLVPTEAIETVEPEPTVETEITEPAETPIVDATETVPTVEPTPTPDLVSSLTSAVAAPLTCTPSSGLADEPIAAGATLDYDCTFAVELHGQNLSPDHVALAWNVSMSTDSNWTGQLAASTVNDGTWTEPGTLVHIGSEHASLDGISQTPAPAAGQGSSIDGLVTITFQLRLSRPQCTSDQAAFQLSATTSASAPGDPQATVVEGSQPDPLTITPSLVPLDTTAPVVSIESFAVDPVAFSLDDRTTSGVMTIHVENSTMQCSASDVAISVQAFVGTDISNSTSIVSVGALTGAPDENYVALASEPGAPLTASVIVSTIDVGATPGSYTQTITFEVAVPGQISAGTFEVQASATVEERGP